jgi:hypothetical protein
VLNRYVPAAWQLAGYEAEMAEVAMIAIHQQLMRANGLRLPITNSLGLTWCYR